MVKRAGIAVWLVGLAALIAVAVWTGLADVGQALADIGWGILLVVLARAVAIAIAGTGWWLLFPTPSRPKLRTCVLLRFVREAANVLLPMAQVGGDIIGAGLLRLHYAVPGSLAAASVIVDVLMQAATQFLFATAGLAVLVMLDADAMLASVAAIGLGVAALLLAGFYFAQRQGVQRLLRAAIMRLARDANWRALGTLDAVYQNLAAIYASRRNLLASAAVHLTGWLVGVTEVLIVFACLGHPVGLAEALVIESLLHAIRGAAFVIPSALGVQEGGLVLLCAAFGIPASEALALSLAKRAADLVLGAPSLVAWQVLDWRRLFPLEALRVRAQVSQVLPSQVLPLDPKR
jgi:putative membrane protein